MSFAACQPIILASEGKISNNPRDPGGLTNEGITLKTLSLWLGRPAAPAELLGMSDSLRDQIYQARYYNAAHCDELPAGVDLMDYDESVNEGPGDAILHLQRAVGAKVDGQFGPKTRAAVLVTDPKVAIANMHAVNDAFYRSRLNFDEFGDGWIARNDRTRSIALVMAAAPSS